jgi:hypothetical protein
MPKGPMGVSRPGVSSSINITIEMNAPQGNVDDMVVEGLTKRFNTVSSITINEETEFVKDQSFDKVVVEILLDSNEVMLSRIEDLTTDIENALGQERIGVLVEAT